MRLPLLSILVLAACLLAGWWLVGWPFPPGLALVANPLPAVASTLGTFAVIAVFVERTVEVYVVSTREPARVALTQVRDTARTAGDPDAIRAAEGVLAAYGAETQRHAILTALALGVLLGLFGLSVLGGVFVSTVDLHSPQFAGLRLLDVIIVGGLLAGGSAPIHQIITALQDRAALSRANTAADAEVARVRGAAARQP